MSVGRWLGVVMVGLSLIAACSGGGSGSAAKSTTTVASTTTTTLAATTTTTPEDAVKQAYLDYWKMIDRILPTPNPDDAELAQRTIDPILSFLRDDLATRRSEGRTTEFPSDPALNSHRIERVVVTGTSATVDDCFVDGRIAVAPDGTKNAAVVTKHTKGLLLTQGGAWLVSDVQFLDRTDGVAGCAA